MRSASRSAPAPPASVPTRQPISAQDDMTAFFSGATAMRQPSITTSPLAPAKPSASEKATVHHSRRAGSPAAMPHSATTTSSCAATIQPRRRPSARPSTGQS